MTNDELWNLKMQVNYYLNDDNVEDALKVVVENREDLDAQFVEIFLSSLSLLWLDDESVKKKMVDCGFIEIIKEWKTWDLSLRSQIRLGSILNELEIYYESSKGSC